VFSRACHWSILWARSIHLTPSHPTSFIHILILTSHLYPGLASELFASGIPPRTLCTFLLVPMCAAHPAHLSVLDCFHSNNIWQVIPEDLPCQCDKGLSLYHVWCLCRCVVSEIGTHLSCHWWSHCTAPSPSRTHHRAMRWSHWSSSC
jgi:hypothetical protein